MAGAGGDLAPQYSGTSLLAHYGSPVITRQNTVIHPVKTGAADGFRIEARDGVTGALKWTATTNYTQPAHNWTMHVVAALTPQNRVYFADAGGTLSFRDSPDAATGAGGRRVFYGQASYETDTAAFDANVKINTPLTTDRYGNVFFGFVVSGATTPALQSGIARIAEDGTGSWVSAASAAADGTMTRLPHNLAPALSNDHRTLYVAVRGSDGFGCLLALDSRTLATTGKIRLKDGLNALNDARLLDDGTAAPMVGPDGDVYFGVFEHSWGSNHYRGWLRHYDKTLTQTKPTGAFGWDHTPSVVPAKLVPAYQGTSKYLLLSKYNNYAGVGGDGVNKLAILDPNETMTDPISGAQVMKEVMTIVGPTPDLDYTTSAPNAVLEWCVNTVAIDTAKHSAIVHSEDGHVYRWDFHTNTLAETLMVTPDVREAYTPSVIGVDGTVYVVANAILFAIGEAAP
ncbi:MAG TPA: hypothetical protein DDZ88_15155 [Verrucomicrobiales bacterium]|nr:hypothetical protein [Verrucomicrobiales bacterium]